MRLLVEMQSPVPDLVAHRHTENLGLLPGVAQNPREKGWGIRAYRVYHLRLVIFSDLLELLVFGPGADWELDKGGISTSHFNQIPGKIKVTARQTLITSR